MLEETNSILILDDKSIFEEVLLKSKLEEMKIPFTRTSVRLVEDIQETFNIIVNLMGEEKCDTDLLVKINSLLVPGGYFISCFKDSTSNNTKLQQQLILSGFVNIKFDERPFIEINSHNIIIDQFNNFNCIKCQKPNYEVGSTKRILLNTVPKNLASAWKVDDTKHEFIEDDDLLDANDLKKPDSMSLKVCGTTGKRKACKDCTCGLAEELDDEVAAEITDSTKTKSSCGNCYLGDAFRCASCPYLGMPSFKPGEKVQLGDDFLSQDL